MLFELLVLAGLFLIFVGILLLVIIKWLEAREERKLSERLSRYHRPGDSYDDVRFKDYEK